VTPKFKALQLKARHQVYTLLSGHNLSRLHGEGYDFAELREYQVGDDIRKINWTITAKLGKPYIKELHANRELSVVVASLMDGGVYVGESNTKQRLITEVAAILGYAAQHSNDLFTGISFTPQKTVATPPTKQLFDIEHFCEHLYEASLLNTTLDTNASLESLFKRLHKPSLLFVLHDFLEPLDLSLLAQRHDVVAIVIRDNKEEALKKQGAVRLYNPKKGNSYNTFIGSRSAKRYLAHREENDTKMLAHFSHHDIRYVKIFTNEEPMQKLLTLFR
jgi:uncharacterized protein (DUF58 family)